MESQQGSFLISTSKMPDPRFREKLIYMCGHTEEGAIGLVVNNPLPDVTLDEILINANIPVPDFELPPVYIGGPVEMESGFILYTADYHAENQLEVSPTVCLSMSSIRGLRRRMPAMNTASIWYRNRGRASMTRS